MKNGSKNSSGAFVFVAYWCNYGKQIIKMVTQQVHTNTAPWSMVNCHITGNLEGRLNPQTNCSLTTVYLYQVFLWTRSEPLTAQSRGFTTKQLETNVWESRRNSPSQGALKLCVFLWGGGHRAVTHVFIFLELTCQRHVISDDIPRILPKDWQRMHQMLWKDASVKHPQSFTGGKEWWEWHTKI